ncbi:ABC transporter ATP-binding protein [Fibrobacter sp. UWB2]|uniref:ABC transporter ATP-binding protein n=1 Tax=Fibrobacter sp. UWB2 TaxID=1964358 RepID=UPI001E4117AB|nr:ABC transporter ATP-binding protein [Fibrobacter sp. UWB2]
MSNRSPVLSVKEVSVAFGFDKNDNSRDGRKPLQVTDRVSFDIFPGEFFALVGESGCGKSVTAMSILRLLPWPSAKIVNGEILFDAMAQDSRNADDGNACDLATLPLKDLQSVRGSEIACIFQEPMQALNPVVTIKKQLLEVFKFGAVSKSAQSKQDSSQSQKDCHSRLDRESPLDLVREQLRLAGFTDPDRVLNSYPHELSGGMLQRVCIVMALLPKPKLIIADEPTTALDVTVQAQVLAVLKEMAEKTGTAVLLITHNMGIVSQYAHRVAVMYAGRIVEEGPVREVINHPMHPYTQGLLAAIPESHSDLHTLASIPGSVPHPKDFAKGCRFADRCCKCAQASAEVREKCLSAELPTKIAEADHFAYCFCAK